MTAPNTPPRATHGNAWAAAYLTALQRRSAERSPAVRQALQPRLQTALAMVGDVGVEPRAGGTADAADAGPGPLALLRHELAALATAAGQPDVCTDDRQGGSDRPSRHTAQTPGPLPDAPTANDELRAWRHPGAAWPQLHVQQRLRQSLAKAPEQAGPLNSHALALRTLQALHTLSPGYLLHFMQQMEGLFALEQRLPTPVPRTATEATAAVTAGAARRTSQGAGRNKGGRNRTEGKP